MKIRSITLIALLLASLNLQAQEQAASPEKLSFSATQEVQLTAVIDAIFRDQSRLSALLDAVAQGELPRQSIDSLRRSQLLAYPEPGIRRRAEVCQHRCGKCLGRGRELRCTSTNQVAKAQVG